MRALTLALTALGLAALACSFNNGQPTATPLFRTATPLPPASTARPIGGPPHNPPPAGAPLSIQRVEAAEIRRDPSRPSGAIVVVRVVFSGGLPPFRFFDEGLAQPGNPYELAALC